MNDRMIASVEAVPTRIAVAYLSIWSYCSPIRSHRIWRVIAGARPGHRSGSPAAGRYSFTLLIRLIRGRRFVIGLRLVTRSLPTPLLRVMQSHDVVGGLCGLAGVVGQQLPHIGHPIAQHHHGGQLSSGQFCAGIQLIRHVLGALAQLR